MNMLDWTLDSTIQFKFYKKVQCKPRMSTEALPHPAGIRNRRFSNRQPAPRLENIRTIVDLIQIEKRIGPLACGQCKQTGLQLHFEALVQNEGFSSTFSVFCPSCTEAVVQLLHAKKQTSCTLLIMIFHSSNFSTSSILFS